VVPNNPWKRTNSRNQQGCIVLDEHPQPSDPSALRNRDTTVDFAHSKSLLDPHLDLYSKPVWEFWEDSEVEAELVARGRGITDYVNHRRKKTQTFCR
jgi:hypothetical protein